MLSRLGSSLVLLGLIVLTVFLLTLSNEQGDARVLIVGAFVAALGLVLRRRATPPSPQTPSRFRFLRRLLGRKEEDGS